MSDETLCPHCLNAIDKKDTTCTKCGESTRSDFTLHDLCDMLGIPTEYEAPDGNMIIFRVTCDIEGVHTQYVDPKHITEIIEENAGVIH